MRKSTLEVSAHTNLRHTNQDGRTCFIRNFFQSTVIVQMAGIEFVPELSVQNSYRGEVASSMRFNLKAALSNTWILRFTGDPPFRVFFYFSNIRFHPKLQSPDGRAGWGWVMEATAPAERRPRWFTTSTISRRSATSGTSRLRARSTRLSSAS